MHTESKSPCRTDSPCPAVPTNAAAWHAKLQLLNAYWESIRPATGLPARRDFNPAKVHRLLPNIWMADVERNAPRFRYRLVGTAIVTALGFDPTGDWIDAPRLPSVARDLLDSLAETARTGKPEWVANLACTHCGADHYRCETLLLPMAADGIAVDVILAISVFIGGSGNELFV